MTESFARMPTPDQLAELREAAYAGRPNGWRPYSKFAPAASVLTVDGRVHGGVGNVENANYTLTKHAEETALIVALAAGALTRCGRVFVAAIYLPTVQGAKVVPCGGCRQFIWEFADEETLLICELPDGGHQVRRLIDLFEDPFGPAILGITESDNPTEF